MLQGCLKNVWKAFSQQNGNSALVLRKAFAASQIFGAELLGKLWRKFAQLMFVVKGFASCFWPSYVFVVGGYLRGCKTCLSAGYCGSIASFIWVWSVCVHKSGFYRYCPAISQVTQPYHNLDN